MYYEPTEPRVSMTRANVTENGGRFSESRSQHGDCVQVRKQNNSQEVCSSRESITRQVVLSDGEGPLFRAVEGTFRGH